MQMLYVSCLKIKIKRCNFTLNLVAADLSVTDIGV